MRVRVEASSFLLFLFSFSARSFAFICSVAPTFSFQVDAFGLSLRDYFSFSLDTRCWLGKEREKNASAVANCNLHRQRSNSATIDTALIDANSIFLLTKHFGHQVSEIVGKRDIPDEENVRAYQQISFDGLVEKQSNTAQSSMNRSTKKKKRKNKASRDDELLDMLPSDSVRRALRE